MAIEFYGGYEVYSESGVDLTLLRENLRRSIEERIQANARAMRVFEAVRASGSATTSICAEGGVKDPPPLDAAAMLRQLSAHHVEFVVIGGLAMIAHGSDYVTKDLDICYSRSPQNLAAVSAALAPLHPYLRGVPEGLPFRLDVPTLQAGLNFTLCTDAGSIDLLGEVSGVGQYDRALAQAVDRTIFGFPVRVLSLDGLIAAKKAAGRRKDQGHLLELEELKKMTETDAEEQP